MFELPFNAEIWGTVSEAFGAIGTTAAAVGAAAVYIHSVFAATRAQARLIEFRVRQGNPDKELIISVKNNSSEPITGFTLIFRQPSLYRVLTRGYAVYKIDSDGNPVNILPPEILSLRRSDIAMPRIGSGMVHLRDKDSSEPGPRSYDVRVEAGQSVTLAPLVGKLKYEMPMRYSVVFRDNAGIQWQLFTPEPGVFGRLPELKRFTNRTLKSAVTWKTDHRWQRIKALLWLARTRRQKTTRIPGDRPQF